MSNEEDVGEPSTLASDLSDDSQMFTAEYKDGQLQIVEVSPYDKVPSLQSTSEFSESILPDLEAEEDKGQPETEYLQVLDGKGLMQLNLLNFALVKSADGSSSYQLVSTGDGGASEHAIACLLSDGDEDDPRESYVMLQADDEESPDPQLYLQAEERPSAEATEEMPQAGDEESPDQQLHLQTEERPSAEAAEETPQATNTEEAPKPVSQSTEKRKLTPLEILEKAKALQKRKAQMPLRAPAARRRAGALPPPLELLSSPGFKLYLYSCKLCTFKCNAVKEMSLHKKSEHAGGGRGAGRGAALQCARCPYKAHTHTQDLHVSCKDTDDQHASCTDTDVQHDSCTYTNDQHVSCTGTDDQHVSCTDTDDQLEVNLNIDEISPSQRLLDLHVSYTDTDDRHVSCTDTDDQHVTCTYTDGQHVTCTDTDGQHVSCTDTDDQHVSCTDTDDQHVSCTDTDDQHVSCTDTDDQLEANLNVHEISPSQRLSSPNVPENMKEGVCETSTTNLVVECSSQPLMKHIRDSHTDENATIIMSCNEYKSISLDSSEVMAADILVCGACGFESDARDAFRRHVETEHATQLL